MPQGSRENPFDTPSQDQSAAMAWLPHPSTETVRLSESPAIFLFSSLSVSLWFVLSADRALAPE